MQRTNQKVVKLGAITGADRVSRTGYRKRQSGATMTDFMIWSILAATIAVVLYAAFNRGASGQRGSDLAKEFNEMAAAASNVYTGQWGQFNTANARQSGLFRNYANIVDDGSGTINLKGGGTLTVAPGNVQNANDSGQYTLAGLEEEACKKFLVGIGKGSQTIQLNGTPVKTFGAEMLPTASCTATNNTVIAQKQ